MNITPTPEVVTEIGARSVYLMQNYLYWKQEVDSTGDRDSRIQLDKWETRMHEFLKGIGATDWRDLKTLIAELTIKTDY
jgi:hypothetical protein